VVQGVGKGGSIIGGRRAQQREMTARRLLKGKTKVYLKRRREEDGPSRTEGRV